MGTKTFGNTSATAGNTYYSTANGTTWCSNSTGTAPEDMWVDQVFVYCGAHSGGSSNFTFGIFTTGLSLLASTDTRSYGTGYGWNHGAFAAGSYYHIANGGQFRAGFFATGSGSQIQTATNSGSFWIQLNTSSIGSMTSASQVTLPGDEQWYLTYFPTCTVTGIPSSPVAPGTNFTVTGTSFTAGVNSVTIGGVACTNISVTNDTTLTCNAPAQGVTGQVQVATNAGTGTSAGTMTVGQIWYGTGTAVASIANVWYSTGTSVAKVAGIWVPNGAGVKRIW